VWTGIRMYVPSDGYFRPPLMLLGRLGGVDLKITKFGSIWGLANRHLFPNLNCAGVPRCHATKRISPSLIHFSEHEFTFTFAICCRPSVCRLSVCNARAPYSGGSNFRQYFYGIMYLGHPLTSTGNFTEIVPGEPLHRGS